MDAYPPSTRVFFFGASPATTEGEITHAAVKYGTVIRTNRLADETQIVNIELDNNKGEIAGLPAAAVTRVT